MSFDRLSSLESQPTTMRRTEDPEYQDDPEFSRLTEQLSNKLFELTTNISRLSNEIALLGTKRDTDRVRERVHDLLEETRDGFKEIGDGIKQAQGWEDLNVMLLKSLVRCRSTDIPAGFPTVHCSEAIERILRVTIGIPGRPASRSRETAVSIICC